MTDEQWVPGNKSELISAIEREWRQLMDVVAKLEDANKMTTPDEGEWSPKDNLAHLTEWINILMGYHMDERPSHELLGISEDVTKDWDYNEINRMLFERNKDRSTQDIMDELKRVYAELIKRLDAAPFEDLLKPRHIDDPEKRPLLLWVLGNTSEHFEEHRITMEKLL